MRPRRLFLVLLQLTHTTPAAGSSEDAVPAPTAMPAPKTKMTTPKEPQPPSPAPTAVPTLTPPATHELTVPTAAPTMTPTPLPTAATPLPTALTASPTMTPTPLPTAATPLPTVPTAAPTMTPIPRAIPPPSPPLSTPPVLPLSSTSTTTSPISTSTTMSVPQPLARRMLLVYEKPILNQNCDPLFQKAMGQAIVRAASTVTGDYFAPGAIATFEVSGCGGPELPGRPSATPLPDTATPSYQIAAGTATVAPHRLLRLSNNIPDGIRSSGPQQVVIDWILVCPSAAAKARLLNSTVDPSIGSALFKNKLAAYFNQMMGHVFFPSLEDDITLQGTDGCLQDVVRCPNAVIVARDPATCLYPSGSILGLQEDCPSGLAARLELKMSLLTFKLYLVLAVLLVCIFFTCYCLSQADHGNGKSSKRRSAQTIDSDGEVADSDTGEMGDSDEDTEVESMMAPETSFVPPLVQTTSNAFAPRNLAPPGSQSSIGSSFAEVAPLLGSRPHGLQP